MIGNAGANLLDGMGGADILVGKGGDDTYHVDNAGDRVFEETGNGYDRVVTNVSFTLAEGSEVEELVTTSGNTNLTGNSFNNRIVGMWAGTNIIDGGAGADVMIGAEGPNASFDSSDIFYVDNVGDVVVETSNHADPDEVRTWLASYSLAGTKIENLTGLGSLGQSFTGSAVRNIIDGGLGADTMAGGLGDDVYVVDNGGDVVSELAGEGTDEVRTSLASYVLGSTLENLTGISSSGQTLTGNAASNVILAGAGADVINGGAGADTMHGGAGDDIFIVDNAGDKAIEVFLEGRDAVYTSVSYALDASTCVETLSTLDWNSTAALNLTGNGVNNYMIGNAGVNVLDGNTGVDILVGKGGNDVYIVDDSSDIVYENAGEGADDLHLGELRAQRPARGRESLTLDWNATTAIHLTGNSLANWLIGNAGANIMDGRAGNDILEAKAGADTLAFTTALGSGNVDLILGFATGSDKFQLDDVVFTGLATGILNPNAFVIGSAAADADDRILYNSATGQLFFDADGSGAGAAIHFATLQGAPALASSDFAVV